MTDKNTYQRAYRLRTNNRCTRKYEKTLTGFLMRMYRNMKSRVRGVQKTKWRLYRGKKLMAKAEFYSLALNSGKFIRLFKAWKVSGYDRKLTPTPNRIDSRCGYEKENMEFITHSENSRLGALSKRRIK